MPSLSEAFRAHPVYLHHKHSDFNSLQQKLPDSYAWTQPDSHAYADTNSDNNTVPVIDLKDPNAPNLIGHACRRWGVFQVVNHGVPLTLFTDIQRACLALFSLPLHQKLKAARSPDGVSGYGRAPISSFFPKLMWSECFTILDSPHHLFLQLWPQDHAKYSEIVKEYEAAMKELAAKLMCLVFASLGISKEDVKWAGPRGEFDGACAALHWNSYPSCPDPDRAMGLAAHTDSTLLTILHQNNVSGLQVLKDGEGWVAVPPLAGGLVVNIGDLLHIFSNGLYPSVLHRVRVNRSWQRFSVAYLYGPPTNVGTFLPVPPHLLPTPLPSIFTLCFIFSIPILSFSKNLYLEIKFYDFILLSQVNYLFSFYLHVFIFNLSSQKLFLLFFKKFCLLFLFIVLVSSGD